MRKIVFSVLGIAAVLALGIAATSVTQSVLAARNVGGATFADSGGNGGAFQGGTSTANSGAAFNGQNLGATGTATNTGDWGTGPDQSGGTSNAVGCGHIGAGTSSNFC